MPELRLKDEISSIVSAATVVHTRLGAHCAEAAYQEALEIELEALRVPFESKQVFTITYRGQHMKRTYLADLLCYGVIFVELMATERLPDEAEAVMINDMQATGMHTGLLINFGSADKLQWKQLKA
jgi:GxxExxY protein